MGARGVSARHREPGGALEHLRGIPGRAGARHRRGRGRGRGAASPGLSRARPGLRGCDPGREGGQRRLRDDAILRGGSAPHRQRHRDGAAQGGRGSSSTPLKHRQMAPPARWQAPTPALVAAARHPPRKALPPPRPRTLARLSRPSPPGAPSYRPCQPTTS